MEIGETLYCGVRFCGGCNARYDRSDALEKIKSHFAGKVRFDYAKEGEDYDFILVIGGCTNCCASYGQYRYAGEPVKMWDAAGIERVFEIVEKLMETRPHSPKR